MLDESLYLPCHSSSGCFCLSNRVTDGEIYLVSVRQQQVRRGRDPLALVSMCVINKINKNGHLSTHYCEMGKKEQVPALAMFVQGSLWVWSATT